MTTSLRKQVCRLVAGTLAAGSLTTITSAAFQQPVAMLSPNRRVSVGTVLTSAEIRAAEQALNRSREAAQNRAAAQNITTLTADTTDASALSAVAAAPGDSMITTASEQVRAEAIENAKAAAEAEAKTAALNKAKDAAMEKAKDRAEAIEQEEAVKKAKQEAEAAAKKEAEAKAIAAQQTVTSQPTITSKPYDKIVYEDRTQSQNSTSHNTSNQNNTTGSNQYTGSKNTGSVSSSASTVAPEIDLDRTVGYSADYATPDDVANNATLLGNFKLTFYCPCEVCNGRADAKTASGVTMAEGRTIAVDPAVIPLGSRVYIDGFGEFVAEDTGSAIKDMRIDICVSTHEKAYELGVTYKDVYLIS